VVVVSIGTAADVHDLVPDAIAGALAVQIEKLVIDRYRREHPQPSSASAARRKLLTPRPSRVSNPRANPAQTRATSPI
jgi:hypothetical protein